MDFLSIYSVNFAGENEVYQTPLQWRWKNDTSSAELQQS